MGILIEHIDMASFIMILTASSLPPSLCRQRMEEEAALLSQVRSHAELHQQSPIFDYNAGPAIFQQESPLTRWALINHNHN